MRHRKLVLRRTTIRHLTIAERAAILGGNTQGAACDNSVGKTQCDLAGCAFCTASCNICDPPLSQPQSCMGCTND